MRVATSQTHIGAHEYGLLNSLIGSAALLTNFSSKDHSKTNTAAKFPFISISDTCTTDSMANPSKEDRPAMPTPSFLKNYNISPAQRAAPHNKNTSNTSNINVTKPSTSLSSLQSTLLSLTHAEARVALLQSKFEKFDRLEQDLCIYEILGEDGEREFRERIEAIKRQKSVSVSVVPTEKRVRFEVGV